MEYLIINGNKLKITLTAEEIEKYSLSEDERINDSPETRRTFWRILDAARGECGFETNGEKVLIQFYKTQSGGELFVTKLGKLTSSTERALSSSRSVTLLSSRFSIYSFKTLNDLIEVIKRLTRQASDKLSLYYGDDGLYYAVCEERGGKSKLSDFSILSEYGDELPETLISYIIEHSKKISNINEFFAVFGA